MAILLRLKKHLNRARRFVPDPAWQHIRSAWFLLAPLVSRRRQVEHLYAGHSLKVWITDPIALEWYDTDWGEPADITFLREAARRRGSRGLRAGATVFDLGAHQGVVAMILGRLVQPDGRICALEANPRNADLARQNVAANDLSPPVFIHFAAAGQRDGEISFNNGLNGQVSARATLASSIVPMRSVDSLAREFAPPDIVYIDVEGFELEVLRGATETLARGLADYFIEMHAAEDMRKFGASVEQILALLPPSRFDLHAMDPDTKPSFGFRPLCDCSELLSSGRRFYLVATWK